MEGKRCFVYFWYLLDRLVLLITLLVLKISLCYVSSDSDILILMEMRGSILFWNGGY